MSLVSKGIYKLSIFASQILLPANVFQSQVHSAYVKFGCIKPMINETVNILSKVKLNIRS